MANVYIPASSVPSGVKCEFVVRLRSEDVAETTGEYTWTEQRFDSFSEMEDWIAIFHEQKRVFNVRRETIFEEYLHYDSGSWR
jgi:hypothetical protein